MKTAVIIPCYNFAQGIRKTVDRIVAWHHQGAGAQVYFVDDGSSDDTGEILRDACGPHTAWCHVLTHAKNRGKGAAIRTGFSAAQSNSEVVIFTDCDLHYGLDVISDCVVPCLSDNDFAIVDRSWREVRHRSIFRRLASPIFNRLVSILTGVNYGDTQGGVERVQSRFMLRALRTFNSSKFCF